MTGELLGETPVHPSEAVEAILRGRDYVTDPSVLHESTTDDLAGEPAHV